MKVLAVAPGPNFSVQDVYTGWCEGLALNGAQVFRYNLDDRLNFYSTVGIQRDGVWELALDEQQSIRLAVDGLFSVCFRWRPDVLLVVSGFYTPPEVLDLVRAAGIRVVIVHTEQPYELGRELRIAAHADLNVINDPTHIEQFRAVAPTVYVPHAYRPHVHTPDGPGEPSDFAFVGTGYASRIAFLEAVDWSGLQVRLAGNWQQLTDGSPLRPFVEHDLAECIDNADAVTLYRGAAVSANLYRREAERPELAAGWAMGPREVEMAACGLFYLRDPRGEGDELLSMLPTFDGPQDFTDQLHWWLGHPEQRRAAADAARAAVADRTFQRHAAQMLRLVDA